MLNNFIENSDGAGKLLNCLSSASGNHQLANEFLHGILSEKFAKMASFFTKISLHYPGTSGALSPLN